MTPSELNQHIRHFFGSVGRSEIEIYNEFSLQHEFGTWLRVRIGDPQTRVQFERPAKFFGVERKLTKKEIDLVCFTPPAVPLAAVEFKFPRAGQVPIQMFKFCQDVAFLEELVLKEKRFPLGCALFAADDRDFYQGNRHQAGTIYSIFRDGAPLKGVIEKSTGTEEPPVELLHEYTIEWHAVNGLPDLRFAMITVSP